MNLRIVLKLAELGMLLFNIDQDRKIGPKQDSVRSRSSTPDQIQTAEKMIFPITDQT